ncbi:MAG: phosphatidate cytidylyltransferase [Mycoplasmoidaceae bacterium]
MITKKFNKNLIRINNINVSQKEVFWKRFLMAFFILSYWILILITCLISDNSLNDDWYINLSPNATLNLQYKGIFAYMFICLLIPFIYGAVYEINKLFFGAYSRKTFIFLLLGILILCILPNFAFITKFYYFTPIKSNLNPGFTSDFFTIFSLFTITLLIGFIILLTILIFLVVNSRVLDLKSILLFFILNAVVGFGFFSIGFIGLSKSWLVLFFVLCVSSFTDIFAYLTGLLFGRTQMTKIISPKKTWEGFFFGLFVTILASVILIYFISFGNQTHNTIENLIHVPSIYENLVGRWFFLIFLVIGISLISTVGDLAFSLLKREYLIKDYGTLFKNHGGVLDRFDSILFAFTLYTLLIFFMSGITESKLFQ